MTSARRGTLVATGVLLLALSGGCTDEPVEAPDNGETTSTNQADGDAEGLSFDCPLSAEQVGAILGTTVERDDSTCTYGPASGGLPAAGFLAQLPELCADGFPEQAGYTEPVAGLGVDAFLKVGGAATAEIWVCSPGAFTVYVDTGDSEPATGTAYAEELARAAVAASTS